MPQPSSAKSHYMLQEQHMHKQKLHVLAIKPTAKHTVSMQHIKLMNLQMLHFSYQDLHMPNCPLLKHLAATPCSAHITSTHPSFKRAGAHACAWRERKRLCMHSLNQKYMTI
jgi:hypothetical protein